MSPAYAVFESILSRPWNTYCGHLGLCHLAIDADHGDVVAVVDRPGEYAAYGEPADIVVVVYVCDKYLEYPVRVVLRGRYRGDDKVEKRLQVLGRGLKLGRGGPLSRVRVDYREVELVFGSVQVYEKVVYLVYDLLNAGIRPVYLVYDYHRRQLEFERLFKDETGLGKRPFRCVYEQKDAVYHLEGALDLASEVGVPGGVDDVDLGAVIFDGCVLGKDGYAAFALKVVGVHDPFYDLFVRTEYSRLPEHRVDEGRLAVVDVRYDGDVSDAFS